ncbi:DUF2892 domain-containing protein [Candidatus Woesearchaeota archaeon]|nr:MAG: DUF2892 domain-containing protein [Candidatus Woesearchaeota archaeon]
MKKNEGVVDRVVRGVLAVVFAVLGAVHSPWWFVLALVFGLTAVVGFCPLYALFGFSTCKNR